jgi:hypothetical protein
MVSDPSATKSVLAETKTVFFGWSIFKVIYNAIAFTFHLREKQHFKKNGQSAFVLDYIQPDKKPNFTS